MSPVFKLLLLCCVLMLSACADTPYSNTPRATSTANINSKPYLRIEAGKHTAPINRIDIDADERFVVTASHDKTARVWDAKTGDLLQILRPTIGDGDEGKLYAVAISPDGKFVATAGWTGKRGASKSIYIFHRHNGKLHYRIRNLPNVIYHLEFSPQGDKLAVALGAGNGIRLYSTKDWQEIASDKSYSGDSYSVDFDSKDRLVSSAEDGYIHLYDSNLKLLHKYQTQAGKNPFLTRFSSDGKSIAVGFVDTNNVNVLSGKNLQKLSQPDTKGVHNNVASVAWSKDSQTLYAAGLYHDGNGVPIILWNKGKRSKWQASQQTVMDIKPLKDGSIIYASQDPSLARLNSNGKVVWKQTQGQLEDSGYSARRAFALNNNASAVYWQYKQEQQSGAVKHGRGLWQLDNLQLQNNKPTIDTSHLQKTRHAAPNLKIKNWEDKTNPTLNGKALSLIQYEMSRSLAIDKAGKHFALGTEWRIRYFNQTGHQLWETPVSIAWAINISPDNRWVVAALGDGTIRWYETATGKERLAFYLHPDEKRWVTWTPEGFYAAAEGAEDLIGYHLNRGADKAAEFVKVDQLREIFARVDLVTNALEPEYPRLAQQALEQAGDIRQVLQAGLAPKIALNKQPPSQLNNRNFDLEFDLQDQGGGFGRVEYRVNGEVVSSANSRPLPARAPEGIKSLRRPFTLRDGDNTIEITAYNARNTIASDTKTLNIHVDDPVRRKPSLYVLSIGVTDYRDNSFELKYAADDAIDFAATLEKQGRKLYKNVETEVLVDQESSLANIESAFENMAAKVEPQDVFVLYLAGHGKILDGRYHFIPHEAIYENDKRLRGQSLGEERLRDWISKVEAGKRVMMIDSCHAGKALSLAALSPQARGGGMDHKSAIARLMNATGTSVLAASSTQQQAMEGIVENGQGRGLFTHVMLKGLQGNADIIRRDGYINVEELQSYAREEVPKLSKQHWQYEQFPQFQLNGHDFPLSQVSR